MKVCFFGSYQKTTNNIASGNGGVLLKKILETQDVEIIECQEDVNTIPSFFKAYTKLFFKHRKLKYDAMIIPWRGIITLPLAKLIHRGPIIYFPAFSIYDTLVNDRKRVKKNSLRARIIHLIDKIGCQYADRIILESTEEIKYFVKEFGISKNKFNQYWLSSDESIFFPSVSEVDKHFFRILIFGTFIPLHGIDTIVQAANILKDQKDILFTICGDGQTKPEIEKLVSDGNRRNVKLLGLVSIDKLLDLLNNSDVCLGIFGNSMKAKKVLTNKVYQILASKKPLITMESPTAIEAKLKSGINCILVPPSNPEKLADAILFMKNNRNKCQQIADAGFNTYLEEMSMKIVGMRLVGIIKNVCGLYN